MVHQRAAPLEEGAGARVRQALAVSDASEACATANERSTPAISVARSVWKRASSCEETSVGYYEVLTRWRKHEDRGQEI